MVALPYCDLRVAMHIAIIFFIDSTPFVFAGPFRAEQPVCAQFFITHA